MGSWLAVELMSHGSSLCERTISDGLLFTAGFLGMACSFTTPFCEVRVTFKMTLTRYQLLATEFCRDWMAFEDGDLPANGVCAFSLLKNLRLYVVARTLNPSTRKAEAGRSLHSRLAWFAEWVPGQSGLYSETLSQNIFFSFFFWYLGQ